MFGRLITRLVVVMLAGFVAAPIAAEGATTGYHPKVTATCNVQVVADSGKALRALIAVQGNATDPVSGTVTVKLIAPNGTTFWSGSKKYDNRAATMRGPVVPKGLFKVLGSFSSSSSTYTGAHCTNRLDSKGVLSEENPPPGGNNNGPGSTGGLPNTGGPSIWLVVLGGGLVLIGATTVAGSKRKKVHAWTP
ncbi:LPXTG cell wall anchor domain-containing protein [Nocardioides montaniterrae]